MKLLQKTVWISSMLSTQSMQHFVAFLQKRCHNWPRWHRHNLRGYQGYSYPHILDWGVQYPSLFRTKSEEFAVYCCQQKRSAKINLQQKQFIFTQQTQRQPIEMLGQSSGNHDWLLANASAWVSCGFRLRNARNASDCVWMETGLNARR